MISPSTTPASAWPGGSPLAANPARPASLSPLTLGDMAEAKNLKDQALDHIHTMLMSGQLKWSDRVSEEAIAKLIGISRTPVREALHLYTQLGIFQRVHRYGTIVRMPELREVEELFEIRVALESYAVSEAVRFISVAELDALKASCDQLLALLDAIHKSGDKHLSEEQVKILFSADHAFHLGIIRAPGNRMLIKQVSDNRMLIRILGGFHLQRFGEANIAQIHADHFGIYQAIERKDTATATRMLVEHIRESKRGVVAYLKKDLDRLDEQKFNATLRV
jgi:DNA-binding GntR family transcriptional regulator